MHDDYQLLQQYLLHGSRPALDALISRHLPLVYSSALRQVRNGALAEDVTQAVFLILTKKARTIRSGVAVGGWLISVTRSVAVNSMKKRATDKSLEQKAARPEAMQTAAAAWDDVSQVIDAELSHLGRKDRDAIVLRFFEDRSFAEIGTELGMTAEAARKRVTRSLERLRARIDRRQRSADVSPAALSAAIAAFAVGAAPHHLLARTLTALHGSPTIQGSLLMKGALKMLAYQKAKLVSTVAAAMLVCAAGGVALEKTFAPPDTTAAVAALTPAAPAVAQMLPATPAVNVAQFSATPATIQVNLDENPEVPDAAAGERVVVFVPPSVPPAFPKYYLLDGTLYPLVVSPGQFAVTVGGGGAALVQQGTVMVDAGGGGIITLDVEPIPAEVPPTPKP